MAANLFADCLASGWSENVWSWLYQASWTMGGGDGGEGMMKVKAKGWTRPSYEPFRAINWLKF